MKTFSRCWAIIDLDVIENNVRELKGLIPADCRFMAVIKAEGYGLGMLPVAEACLAGGANWFGVATLQEAVELRQAGIEEPILVLGVTPPSWAKELSEFHIAQTVPSLEYARQLSENLNKDCEPIAAHIKIDTGMGRLGWYTSLTTLDEVVNEIKKVHELSNIIIQGVFTHLSSSRDASIEAVGHTKNQLQIFLALCGEVEKAGIHIPLRHALNTGGLINYTNYSLEMVRIGHIIYENIEAIESDQCNPAVKSAIEIKASIAFIKEVPTGTAIGYDRMYITTRPTRIAVLGLGYCDGYNAFLTNKGRMLLRGQFVPVIGRVCMDQLIIDITDMAEATIGDVVTIVGNDGDKSITMCQILGQAKGIMNGPVSSCISNRMQRYYRKNGEIIAYADARLEYISCSGVQLP
ncbi:MAG TPA: alanine racemase [Clostridia bacterium]|nr:alanine racemase [Clostridia bacterium]